MMWKVGMHLLFENKVGRITKIFNSGKVSMRVFSKGNTVKGYDWQLNTNVGKLNKLYETNKVRVIKCNEEILICLFSYFKDYMPINNVNEI